MSRFPFGYDSKKSKKNEDNGKDEERHRSRSGSSTSAPTTCAKLCWKSGGDVEQINFLLTNGGKMQDYWGVNKAREPLLSMIAIPTTAGTGRS